jgi:hypothetical protein
MRFGVSMRLRCVSGLPVATNEPRYIRQAFQRRPDFCANSVHHDLADLLARPEQPT